MKKVGILTFHFNYNYGAILQSYASAKFLEKSGYEPEFPNYLPPYFVNLISPFRGWGLRDGDFLKKIPKRLSLVKRRGQFNRFRKNSFNFSAKYSDRESLAREIEKSYYGLVVGSDQVWNLKWMDDFDSYYFLGFLKGAKVRRIAYAACFGQKEQNANRLVSAGALIQEFDSVGVRNTTSAEIVKKAALIDASIVVDPTLLHDYSEVKSDYSVEGNYILVYGLEDTLIELGAQIASQLKERKGWKIVYIASEHGLDFPAADIYLKESGPEVWLQLFRQASFVVTDSFHGCVFSIKYKRPFIAYTNGWRSMRITELLSRYGFIERLVMDSASVEEIDLIVSLGDEVVPNGLLEADINYSKKFLLDALSES